MTHRLNKMWGLFFGVILVLDAFCFYLPARADTGSVLETGIVVNAKMKSLAAGADLQYWTETKDIKAIRMADSLPDYFIPSETNTVSTPDSGHPIYIFFDNEENAGIMYFYTEGDTISLNPDSGCLLEANGALTDISALADWDSSDVYTLYGAFRRDPSLSDISPLSRWDTGSLIYAGFLFDEDSALTDISALSNWNTSNVTDMRGLFINARNLKDALALRNWDTSNVTDMSYMFSHCVSLLFVDVSNWNTSKVVSMSCMFQVGDNWKGNGQLIEIIGLGDLDVSNVTDMTSMFYGAGQMTTYDIARWNVSKVESMNHMFCDNFKLRSVNLSNWDVSNLKTIYDMFDDNMNLRTIGDVSHWNTANLIDAGGWLNGAHAFVGDNNGVFDLSGWDTSNLRSAGEMFYYTSFHTIDLSGWTFDSITNDLWEGSGSGIYYETGNSSDEFKGLGSMFKDAKQLTTVYVSQSGLDSFNKAVENGVNTKDMWSKTKAEGFTVK